MLALAIVIPAATAATAADFAASRETERAICFPSVWRASITRVFFHTGSTYRRLNHAETESPFGVVRDVAGDRVAELRLRSMPIDHDPPTGGGARVTGVVLRPRQRLPIAAAMLGIAVLLTGCTVHEVTHIRNGEEVTDDELPLNVAEIDACAALSNATKEALGLAELEPVPLLAPDAGCSWEGHNDYVIPSLILWVNEPEDGNPSDEKVMIDGVEVNVYSAMGNIGRYIAYLEDVTLRVNYKGAELDIDAHDALKQAMSDVLAHYGRT